MTRPLIKEYNRKFTRILQGNIGTLERYIVGGLYKEI